MKKLEELGISPAPWRVCACISGQDIVDGIEDANGQTIVETDYGVYPPELPDACMMAAAPKMYAALYELLGEACQHCDLRDACQEGEDGMTTACNAVINARAVLAEAAGESEVK